jgi:hypothetical protein
VHASKSQFHVLGPSLGRVLGSYFCCDTDAEHCSIGRRLEGACEVKQGISG